MKPDPTHLAPIARACGYMGMLLDDRTDGVVAYCTHAHDTEKEARACAETARQRLAAGKHTPAYWRPGRPSWEGK